MSAAPAADDISPACNAATDDNVHTKEDEMLLPSYKRGEGLLNEEDYARLTEAVKIASAPILIVEVLTNAVAILVFMRMPSNVTSIFFCLFSGLDMMYLVSAVPSTFAPLVLGQMEALRSAFYIHYVLYVSGHVLTTTRKVIVCVTIMMSLDRYLVVAFPIRMRAFHHLRRPLLYTSIVAALAFLCDTNVLLKNKIITDAADNHTVLRMTPTEVFTSNTQLFSDIGLVSSCVFQYIPLTLLAVFNVLLVAALVTHSRRMKTRFGRGANDSGTGEQGSGPISVVSGDSGVGSISSDLGQGKEGQPIGEGRRGMEVSTEEKSRLQRQKSVTVLAYSFLFIALALPSTFFPLFRKVIPGFMTFPREHYLVMALGSVFVLLDTVSSAMNFFVYLTTGSAFRAGVARLVSRGHQ